MSLGKEQIGGWSRAASPSNSSANMYFRSRNQLADFQAQQAAKKQAKDQDKQQQRMQAEQRAIEARLREATHTPEKNAIPDMIHMPSQSAPSDVREPVQLHAEFNETKFVADAFDLRNLATQLKGIDGMDDVDRLGILMERAAKQSNNNPVAFIGLMNEVLIGDFGKWDYALLVPPRQLKLPRINIGDTGMNPLYQDHSAMQAYHLWVYVNYGFNLPKDVSKAANIFHENIEPNIRSTLDSVGLNTEEIYFIRGFSKTGSIEDYRLSAVGYNLGQALSKGHLTPYETYKLIDTMLRTDKYNVFGNKR